MHTLLLLYFLWCYPRLLELVYSQKLGKGSVVGVVLHVVGYTDLVGTAEIFCCSNGSCDTKFLNHP